MNGEIVGFIPMMPSHTAGDTVMRFRKANATYIEDFHFERLRPENLKNDS